MAFATDGHAFAKASAFFAPADLLHQDPRFFDDKAPKAQKSGSLESAVFSSFRPSFASFTEMLCLRRHFGSNRFAFDFYRFGISVLVVSADSGAAILLSETPRNHFSIVVPECCSRLEQLVVGNLARGLKPCTL